MAAVLAESPVGVASSATGRFEVGYVTEDGAEHRVRLDEAWLVPLERALPVRGFGARKGQRHLSGLWWSATTGGHVGFESWLERDHLVALDFDRSVAGIASQPFWLYWTDPEGKRVSHAPDYFARPSEPNARNHCSGMKRPVMLAGRQVTRMTGAWGSFRRSGGVGSVEAGGEPEACPGRGEPVLLLVLPGRAVSLDADHDLAVADVQVAAVEHVAVDRVAVDLVGGEVTVDVVDRQFPVVAHRRQVIGPECHGVAVRAGQRLPLAVGEQEGGGVGVRAGAAPAVGAGQRPAQEVGAEPARARQ